MAPISVQFRTYLRLRPQLREDGAGMRVERGRSDRYDFAA